MKKVSKIFIKLSMVVIVFSSFIVVAKAQTQPYTVLAPLPGTTSCGQGGGTNCTTDLVTYIPGAFNLAIGISAVLAFVMITFGGIMYATSDAITGKSLGKDYATNAVYGLLLVLGAYAILNTINPELLRINLVIPRPGTIGGTTTVVPGTPTPTTPGPCCRIVNGVLQGYVMSPAQISSDSSNRASLNGVSVNNTACLQGGTIGCTNMNDLPQSVILGLNGLAAQGACGCAITVTGGTEGGHRDHRPGLPVVDIRPTAELNRYLRAPANPPDGARATATLPNGRRLLMTYETAGGNAGGTSTGAHWHTVIE